MSNETQDNNQTSNSQEESIFNIEKLFVKNISLESPRSPKIFFENIQPEIDVKFNINSQQVDEPFYENVITATVTAKVDNSVVFLCEVSQSGIFRLENIDAQSTDVLLNVTCPSILFPYLREVVSETIIRAGFPPIYLAPINFDAMYQQQLEQTENA
ncbi:protein-export chaperone SecB [Neisseriaceae bacterium PsAf]|nr:protein-export chaperone SecB [Neisseriaceae bacterium PsAf]